MTIDALLADDSEDLQLHYNQMVDEAEQSVASLEDVLAGLSEIGDQVAADNAICKTQAVALESVCPGILPRFAAVNSFTQIPSTTNLKIALEEIDKKKAGIIAAIVIAAGAFLYKLWKWISGKSDDTTTAIQSVASTSEVIVKAEEQFQEASHELKQKGLDIHAIETEIRKDESVLNKVHYASDKYNEVVHHYLHQPSNFAGLSKAIGAISSAPMVVNAMQKEVTRYVEELSNLYIKIKAKDPETGESKMTMDQATTAVNHDNNYGGVMRTEVLSTGFDGLDRIKDHLIASGIRPKASGVAELNPAGQHNARNPSEEAQFKLIDRANEIAQWFDDALMSVREQANTPHQLSGYQGISQVLDNVGKFTSSAKVVNSSVDKDSFKKLDDLSALYSPEQVAIRTQALSEIPNVIMVKKMEHLIVVYSQIVAKILQIIRLIVSNTGAFLSAASQYQKERSKSFFARSKDWIAKHRGDDAELMNQVESVRKMIIKDAAE